VTTAATGPQVILEGVRLTSGYVINGALDVGVHAFLISGQEPGAEAGLQEIGELLVGWKAPRRGRVRVGGRAPHAHPATRRRIASVLGSEPSLVADTVGEHLARVSAMLGRDLGSAPPWLDDWRQRPSATLSDAERRTMAAYVALSAPRPLLAVLHEPTKLGAELAEPMVLEKIRSWQEQGVTIVCTTTDVRVAARLGARLWSLSTDRQAPVPEAEYLVRTSAPRVLAARLAAHPAITALRYEDTLPRDLWVRGTDVGALAEAIHRAVVAEGCELYEMTRLERVVHEPTLENAR